MKKRIYIITGATLAAALTWGVLYINLLLPIITGYPAKYLCSAVFISNRNPVDVEALDLNFSIVRFATNEINYQEKSVTSRFLWGRSKAIYREGLGSTLLRHTDEAEVREIKFPVVPKPAYHQDSVVWPLGNILPDTNPGIDQSALTAVTAELMEGKKYQGNAFACVVIYKGILVAEGYRPEFNARTRFLSWSVAKSFTNALAGIMVKDGMLDIYQKAEVGAWQHDNRCRITINDLMQMQSGLKWNEDYGNRSDVTMMLYDNHDFAAFASQQQAAFPAGSHWYYSSGSINIVSKLMRNRFADDGKYYAYATSRLFNRVGMPDAVFETDPSGVLVGSSYLYATARDFARFGLLYLQNGIFCGERILPEGWVKYSTTPASHSQNRYGSCFWLNRSKYYPSAPADMYSCDGHDGQRIFIIPSRELVVVVLGYSPKASDNMNFDLLLKDIMGSLK